MRTCCFAGRRQCVLTKLILLVCSLILLANDAVTSREGANDRSKDLRRAGRDERATGGALFAARRAAAGRGRRLARLERAALPGKRGWLVDVRGTTAHARPLYARLPCRAPGRRRHLQRVPHLRHARGGRRL